MSDRRERVAEAIGAILDAKIFYTNYILADAALAVIDAEPTEAEVGPINVQRDQATMVIERVRHLTFPFTDEDLDENYEPTEAEVEAAYRAYENVPEWLDDDLSENEKDRIGIRAALIAARQGRS